MPLSSLPENSLKLIEHRLIGESVSFKASPNTSGLFEPNAPDTIVVHFPAGSSLQSSVDVLTRANSGVSAHFVIGRNGDIVQLLPTNQIAWHAGESAYAGRSGLNRYSIGIELDNAGQLEAKGDGLFESWFGKLYDERDVVAAQHPHQSVMGYWHKYSDIQIAKTVSLCRVLCAHYSISTVVGHEEIAPSRKVDPGPAFPMEALRKSLMASAHEQELHSRTDELAKEDGLRKENHAGRENFLPDKEGAVASVSANALNLRKGPSMSSPLLDNTLHKGEVLKIVEKQGEWAKVSFTKTGWVNTQYINDISEKLPFQV